MAYYTQSEIESSTKSTVRFSDIDLNFEMNPLTKDVNILKNEDAVKRSVRNIVLTNFGEKKFQPFFGGNVSAQLFENFSPFTSVQLKKAIERSLFENEPRIDRLVVEVIANNDKNSVDVIIRFTLKNSQEPVLVTFTLERIR
jgi:phage baseplate assembly protein W|tara:strand:- start:732 stop:1157 length:426 start_codon:yes stop_codon:yes gene_type:complete